jgi:hypothetical protein
MFKSKDLLIPLRFASKKDEEEEEEPQGSGCCSTSCGGGGGDDQGDDNDDPGCDKRSKSARGDGFGPAGLAMLRRQMSERLAESLARSL